MAGNAASSRNFRRMQSSAPERESQPAAATETASQESHHDVELAYSGDPAEQARRARFGDV